MPVLSLSKGAAAACLRQGFGKARVKLIERGPTGLKDKELMAILLRIGHDKKNAIELAATLLNSHDPHSHFAGCQKGDNSKYPMRKLLSFSVKDFTLVKGIGVENKILK